MNTPDPEVTLTVTQERDMLLELLASVPAGGLADALYACGYDSDLTIPLLKRAGADLSFYGPAAE